MPLMKADSRAAARGRKVWLSPRPLAHISLRALIWLLFIVSRPNPPLADDAPYEPGGGKGKLIIAETLGKHCGGFFCFVGFFCFCFLPIRVLFPSLMGSWNLRKTTCMTARCSLLHGRARYVSGTIGPG